MRDSIREFVSIVAGLSQVREPIYEFGSLQVSGQEGFANLRPFFPGLRYLGCDYREGPGVDQVVDLHSLELPDQCAGTVLCLDTLEHVEFPQRAVAEMSRVLHRDGVIAISSVMNFPIHDYPSDYWRFTPEAFRSLLSGFRVVVVAWAGKPDFPHTVLGIASDSHAFERGPLELQLQRWRERWSQEPVPSPEPARTGWRNRLRPWVPPAALEIYRSLRGR